MLESLKYSLIVLGLGCLVFAGFSFYTAMNYRSPGLVIDRPILDVGQVRQGDICQIEFRLTNNYAGPLQLLGARHSLCGCTPAELSHETLAPGETATLKTAWKSSGVRGETDVLFWLQFQPPGEGIQEVSLIAHANVLPTIQISPNTIRFDAAQDGRVEVHLEDTSGAAEAKLIRTVTSSHEAVAIESVSNRSFVLVYRSRLWHKAGSLIQVTIETTCPQEGYLRLPVVMNNNPSLTGDGS